MNKNKDKIRAAVLTMLEESDSLDYLVSNNRPKASGCTFAIMQSGSIHGLARIVIEATETITYVTVYHGMTGNKKLILRRQNIRLNDEQAEHSILVNLTSIIEDLDNGVSFDGRLQTSWDENKPILTNAEVG